MPYNSILFSALMIAGILIVYPVTPRYFSDKKLFWVSFGCLIAHIGLYGLLWILLSPELFVSILLAEAGTFVFFDPLKIVPAEYRKYKQITASSLVFISVITLLTFKSGFPIWVWFFPAVLGLAPRFIPPLYPYKKLSSLIAIALSVFFVAFMGYKLSDTKPVASKINTSPTPVFQEKQKELPPQTAATSEPATPGTSSLPVPSKTILTAEDNLVPLSPELDEKIKRMEQDNLRLTEELKEKSEALEKSEKKIEEMKKVLGE